MVLAYPIHIDRCYHRSDCASFSTRQRCDAGLSDAAWRFGRRPVLSEHMHGRVEVKGPMFDSVRGQSSFDWDQLHLAAGRSAVRYRGPTGETQRGCDTMLMRTGR